MERRRTVALKGRDDAMTRYDSKTQVGGGYYFNTTSWALHAVDGKRGELPGEANERWVALNSPMMIVAAAVVSFGFVLFLPVIGFVLFGKVVGAAAVNSLRTAFRALMHALSPRWQPGEAWLARPEQKKSEPQPSELAKEVAERRTGEKDR
jgi:hypothetical protein